ncbi:hypothetical protein C0J52_16290, partial [Blattella germanica]
YGIHEYNVEIFLCFFFLSFLFRLHFRVTCAGRREELRNRWRECYVIAFTAKLKIVVYVGVLTSALVMSSALSSFRSLMLLKLSSESDPSCSKAKHRLKIYGRGEKTVIPRYWFMAQPEERPRSLQDAQKIFHSQKIKNKL